MDTEISEQVHKAVLETFTEANIALPSIDNPIVPLAQLVSAYDLTMVELSGLSSHVALGYLEGRGVPTYHHNTNNEALAGYLYTCGRFGCIFVEKYDMLVRRRFSCAHELGHYKLHFLPRIEAAPIDVPPILEAIDRPYDEDVEDEGVLLGGELTYTRPGEALGQVLSGGQQEREANQFAAELLMPTTLTADLTRKYGTQFQGEDLVWRLSTDLLVSQATMRYRLRNLNLI